MVNWDMVSHDRDGMKQRGGQPHRYPIEQFIRIAPNLNACQKCPARYAALRWE